MNVNELPKYASAQSESDCCPKFDPTGWDDQEFVFDNKAFVSVNTLSFLYMPLNMGSVMQRTMKAIKSSDAMPEGWAMLSHDNSAWCCTHYIAVSKDVPGLKMEKLSGTFVTKVFEGAYRDAPVWVKQMKKFVNDKGKSIKKLYFFYTTCPKCAKRYGKNYVVGFAQV